MSDDRNTIYQMQKEIHELWTAVDHLVNIITIQRRDYMQEDIPESVGEELTALNKMGFKGW